MSKLKVHFSSKKQDWETPQDFFDKLDKEFNFDLDVCATQKNAKCEPFISPEDNSLSCDWSANGSVCWMNPPYGRDLGDWIKKAFEEAQKGCTVVALIPSRTDTKYFHKYIYLKPTVEIRFIPGRIKFVGADNSAPFPSMIVIFRP